MQAKNTSANTNSPIIVHSFNLVTGKGINVHPTERNYLVDNCKAILITLVVFGHLLDLGPRNHEAFFTAVWIVIYAFHMPAFMLLSGIFAKPDPTSNTKNIIKLISLYLLMTALVCTTRFALGLDLGFNLVIPVFSAWFLVSLACMRILLPTISGIRFIIPILVIVSLLAPTNNSIGSFLSIARTLYLLPFFMLGYKLGLNGLLEFRNKIVGAKRVLIFASCIGMLLCAVAINHFGIMPLDTMLFKASYSKVGFESLPIAILVRLLLIATACSCIASLLLITPSRKNLFTYIGENSLSVYILQAALITVLTQIDITVIPYFGFIALPLSVIITSFLAHPFFSRIINVVPDLFVRTFLRNQQR